MKPLLLMLVGSAVLAACQTPDSPSPKSPADAVGRGLLHASSEVPVGATTWNRPQWRVGDRFGMVRGEVMHGLFSIKAIEAGAYVVDMGNGRLVHRDLDLGNLGEWQAEDGAPRRVMSPVDVRYHWPLWVGKQWQCEFVDQVHDGQVHDGQALTMNASYVVEGVERIEVPAGVFDALSGARCAESGANSGS